MAKNKFFMDKETIKEIGFNLWKMRRDKRLTIKQLEIQTRIQPKIVEKIEIGRSINCSTVRKLTKFYGKKMKIVFEE